MTKVFISHSTKDRVLVEREVIALLHTHGIETWYSRDEIRTADAWERTIAKGLASCEWFLLVMSPNSATSEWVKDEVHWAIDERPGKIIPLLIDKCNPRDFHLRLARIQYLDFTGNLPDARQRLLATLEVQLAHSPSVPLASTPVSASTEIEDSFRRAAKVEGPAPSATAPARSAPAPACTRSLKVEEIACLTGHSGAITCVAFSPNGQLGVSSDRDSTVQVWDLHQKKSAASWSVGDKPIGSVAFFPYHRRLLVSSADQTVYQFDSKGAMRRFEAHRANWAVALAPDGKQALSGSVQDGALILWEVETGKEIRRFQGHKEPVRGVTFSPDGQQALSSSRDQTVRLWDVSSGRQLQCLTVPKVWLTTIGFTPDGLHAITGNGAAISVWDLNGGSEVRRLQGHAEDVLAATVSADGRTVVSGSVDQTLRIWDLPSGKELACLPGHKGEVGAVVISPDGQHALSGGEDRTVRYWRLSG